MKYQAPDATLIEILPVLLCGSTFGGIGSTEGMSCDPETYNELD